jgi:hypothetical protein
MPNQPSGFVPDPVTPPPVSAGVPSGFVPDGFEPDAPPTFRASNEKDAEGNATVSAWETANTPLLPQIAQAGHAIADFLARSNSLGDAKLNEVIPGAGTLSAWIKGGAAGLIEGAGELASGFTSPVGAVMTIAGLGPESTLVKEIPALAGVLKLPAVRTLQRAIQGTGGAAFAAHGAGQVVTDPTLAGKARGVAEVAAGAAGAASAFRSGAARPAARPTLTPEEAASNAFAGAHDVPLDAATATGRRAALAMQKRVANSIGGEGTAERLIGDQQAALTRVGGELAGDVNAPVPPVPLAPTPGPARQPVQAGEGVRDALAQRAQDHAATASRHYGVIERAEAAAPARFAVDVAPEQRALTPLYERLAREAELAPGAVMGDKARALTALDRLIHGPSVTRLTVLDEVVSDLRTMAGANDSSLMAEGRSAGQGIAAQMVQRLDAKVRSAARAAGPDILTALEDGRAATAAKWEALTVGELLADEPAGIFKQLTAPREGGLNKLRAVQQVAPEQVPHVARAVLDSLLDMATEQGRFGHADKLYAEWQKLGAQTKQLLFPRADLRAELDQFFLLAKRIAANPNPSGTASVNNIFNWFSTVGTYPLAKILYTPGGVRAVTRLLRQTPTAARPATTAPRRAGQVAGWAEVAAAARRAGVSVPLPQAADASDGPPE